MARRLAAVGYDAIVVLGLVIVATLPVVILADGAHEDAPAFRIGLRIYVLAITFAFFAGFWHRGGQTIGMRAWRIRLVGANGGPITWRQAGIRFLVGLLSAAALGLGFLWALVDRDGRTWHDIASATRLVRSA